MSRSSIAVLLLLATLGACASPKATFFEGMGDHVRPVTTDRELAQRYFDQGLTLAYGFNHPEAIRSFTAATKADPDCAMAWWGRAYSFGPYINAGMTPEKGELAYASIQRAMQLRDRVSDVERGLIEALAERYASPPPSDRKHLDQAYARAMRRLWRRNPEDTDVGTLYADAMMNLRPWDLFSLDHEPRPETPEIIETLETVLALDETHPGANHLYIHAIEASAEPARAEEAADRLGSLVPGMGHLVHMPSHIYVQVGRFRDSMEVNALAVEQDQKYLALVDPDPEYYFYEGHNNHFRIWSAMYQGRHEDALATYERMIASIPAPMHAAPPMAAWLTMDLHIHLRFGDWEAALARAEPTHANPYAAAMWHYARGMAYANTDRIAAAVMEGALFEAAAKQMPETDDHFMKEIIKTFEIARQMLAGETAFHNGERERAFEHLRAAVAAEDSLLYTEPSLWMMPTRHALGALLLADGQVEEAKAAYEADLKRHPGNGWSLHGLAECQDRLGEAAEAAKTRAAFEQAWEFATVEIKASCFCRQEG